MSTRLDKPARARNSHAQNCSAGNNSLKSAPKPLRITRSAYEQIRKTIGSHRAETGGLLGGNRESGIITHFHLDSHARTSAAAYSPDCDALNRLLDEEWNPAGVRLMGSVHSHPPCVREPSGGDHVYSREFLKHNQSMQVFFMPLVMSTADQPRFEFLPFAVTRSEQGGVNIQPVALEIVDEEPKDSRSVMSASSRTKPKMFLPVQEAGVTPDETFARVADLYDLPHLAKCRVVCVGTGGSSALIEDLARSGMGQFVLIDPDKVSLTNLATQHYYRSDVGRPKVECLRERILAINPDAKVRSFHCKESELDDGVFAKLLGVVADDELHVATRTLLCGYTDSFMAQARVNALALQFGVPSLCAQLYAGGKQMEMTYTLPEVTQSCHRCITSARYEAYLHQGFVNDVGSAGTPVFATGRLNALNGFLAMGLLHYQTCPCKNPLLDGIPPCWRFHSTDLHCVRSAAVIAWSELMQNLSQRNLAWVRTHPSVNGKFADVFAGAISSNICFDETIWRPQTPDGPKFGRATCPDCGGTGNLLDAKGTFEDTRIIRLHHPSENPAKQAHL